MDIDSTWKRRLAGVSTTALSFVYERAKAIPFVRRRVEREVAEVMKGVRARLRPYADTRETRATLPAAGEARTAVLAEMRALQEREAARWRDGFVSGAVYHGDREHIAFLDEVYSLHSQTNPLHSDLWPSVSAYEAEIVAMTADMLGSAAVARDEDGGVCGVVSSGGTESILLAMKAYRDHARATWGVGSPQIVAPSSAHVAFDKAAQLLGMELVKVPVGADLRADVEAMGRAIGRNTVVVVGSAPSFPHGVIDPIAELSELAREAEVGFHTDACLGGFVLPWAEQLGHALPPWDFRLRGVTSISVDTHKYGYAAKGTSVILYRGRALRRAQYFTATDWPGGLYFSPTLAGSRPGALSAACWASMVSIGADGYREATRAILDAAARIREGIRTIPELELMGDPLWILAFRSPTLDIYRVLEAMSGRGWNLNGLHRPACVHLCVTLRHAQEGVTERFLADLRAAVADVVAHPKERGELAPVYGMAATMPARGVVREFLHGFMDELYEP